MPRPSPSISVLITYHNEAEMLTECLESLSPHLAKIREILVYDDAASVPPEPYIPASFPVRVLKAPTNHGPAFGRNRLLEAASSEYVHFHDADDWFHPAWVVQVGQALCAADVDAVFTEVASTRDTKPRFTNQVLGLRQFSNSDELTRFCIRGAMLVPAGTFRRSRVIESGGYREDVWQSEDYEFHIRLAASGISFRVIQEPLVEIRLRPDSRSKDRHAVYLCAARAALELSHKLPKKFRTDLADSIARCGGQLYREGHRDAAAEVFGMLREAGRPSYSEQGAVYRALATIGGPITAERFGAYYRRLVPEPSRKLVSVNRRNRAADRR